jgi:hypothetical protein
MTISLTPGEMSSIGWGAAGIGVAVISVIEGVGWMRPVASSRRRVASLPFEAIVAAVLLWSWGVPIGAPLAIDTGVGLVLAEAAFAAHAWFWQRRFGREFDRLRSPRRGQ